MNPTTDVLEKRIAQLEGGIGALAVASGSAAIMYAVLNIAKSGDEIVPQPPSTAGPTTFSPTRWKSSGIKTVFVDPENLEDFEKAIT